MYKTNVFKKFISKMIMGSFVFCLAFPVFAGNFYEQETGPEQTPKGAAASAAPARQRLRSVEEFSSDNNLLKRAQGLLEKLRPNGLEKTIYLLVKSVLRPEIPIAYDHDDPYGINIDKLWIFSSESGTILGLLKDLNLPTITRDIKDVTSHPFIKAVGDLLRDERDLRNALDKIAKNDLRTVNDLRTAKRTRDQLFEKHKKGVDSIQEKISSFCKLVDPLIAKVTKLIPPKPEGSLGASFSLGMGVRFRFERDPSYREAFWEKVFRESIHLPPKDHLKALEREHGSIEALKGRIEEKREAIKKEIDTLNTDQKAMELLRTSGLNFKFTKAGISESFHIQTEGKELLNLMKIESFYLRQALEYVMELERKNLSS